MKTPNRPRLRLRIFLLLLIAAGSGQMVIAEAFTIDRFQVDLYLRQDGTFRVVERIQVDFQERRHGIRRLLPYRYESRAVEGELAMNHFPGMAYTTPLDSIMVEGHEYQVERETNRYNIRIGSGDSYVQGKVTYVISYRVYGAINRFLTHDELYWNVTGNEWDTETRVAEITVHLPDGKRLRKDDFRMFTGKKGETWSYATAGIENGMFTAKTDRSLKAGEGFTILLKLPKNYLKHEEIPLRVLAENFVARSLLTEVDLQADGTAWVTETLDLDLRYKMSSLERPFSTRFPHGWLSDPSEHGSDELKLELLSLEYVMDGKDRSGVLNQKAHNGYESIVLRSGADPGRQQYRIRYRLWNAMEFSLGEGRFYFPWLEYNLGDPIGEARCVLRWPPGMILDTARSQIVLSDPARLDQRLGRDSLVLRSNGALDQNFTAAVTLALQGKWNPLKVPMRLYTPKMYIRRYDLEVDLREDGSVHFGHDFVLVNHSYESEYEVQVRNRNELWLESKGFNAPVPQLFGWSGRYLLYEKDLSQVADQRQDLPGPRLVFPIKNFQVGETPQPISFGYTLYGLIGRDSSGEKRFSFPILEAGSAAADSVHFRIRLPGELLLDTHAVKVFALREWGSGMRPVELRFSPGLIEGRPDPGLFNGEQLVAEIHLPEGVVGHSWWLDLRLIALNHPMLLAPIPVFILLLLLWGIFGRDKPFTTVVRYYPPEQLTPTEAGLIIDDKLHNRDLLALIYYWGAKGNLQIQEIFGSDGSVENYRLKKLRDLPRNARKYEKTMFNALFLGRDAVKISKLKDQFYIYMYMARNEVNQWARQKSFYVPGTRAFGRVLRILGILVAIPVVLVAGYTLLFTGPLSHGPWAPVIGWGLIALFLWVFGKIMPRHGAYGLKQYAELKGFMEFVKTAEKDRLRLLVEEDPGYFGLTLSYAIAMGLANDWVAKFGPLLSAPPSYYRSNEQSRFDAGILSSMFTRQLEQMSRSFNSRPAPSGGGYSGGGSGSYSSSSSYSSSGSSGGSGFSGGGGYSGGGYGGGGGSSW